MYLFVTGSRYATPEIHGAFIHGVLSSHYNPAFLQIVHGDADGVDRMAAHMLSWAGRLAVPANWVAHGRRAGPLRNGALVTLARAFRELGHPVAWRAFPMGESRGTYGCVELAMEHEFDVPIHELIQP